MSDYKINYNMSKLSEIYSGWKNLVFENEEIETVATERIRICVEECDQLNDYNMCKQCGCYMPAKTRSPQSRCKLNKWR